MKAAGETTRLRLLSLLDRAELTVTDLVDILDQSQPRISRHLKLLVEAGLAERFQEGAWAYFRAVDRGRARPFIDTVLNPLNLEEGLLARSRRISFSRALSCANNPSSRFKGLRTVSIKGRVLPRSTARK